MNGMPKLIVDRNNTTVKVWNIEKQEYTCLSFETIEDLYKIINNVGELKDFSKTAGLEKE